MNKDFLALSHWLLGPGVRQAARVTGLLLSVGLCLCACSRNPFSGLPFSNMEALKANPPRSIALLPTTDNSGHPEVTEPMRNALYSALASLPYRDRELTQIDSFLQHLAVRRGIPPEQLSPELMADPELADCVIFSQVERINRLYLFFYSHYRLDLNLTMVDTRSRQVLYRNRFRCYNRNGAPFFSLPGILGSTLFSLWHLRAGELDDSIEAAARRIASELPAPPALASGEKNLKIDNVEVTLPAEKLCAEDRIGIHVITNPGAQVTFSIGTLVRDQPMVEESKGRFSGAYTVQTGDNAAYCLVELRIRDEQGEETLEYPVSAYPFIIDTTPPPRARMTAARRLDGDKGLRLEFALIPEDIAHNDEKPNFYHIFRRDAEGPKFFKVGSVKELVWTDPSARASVAYEYIVVTEDEAGNLSPKGEVRCIDAEAS